jgi:hypothetical protein
MSSKTLNTIFWAAAIGGWAGASVQSFEDGNPAAGVVLAITAASIGLLGVLEARMG